VTEFVQDNTTENNQNEEYAFNGRRQRLPLVPINKKNEKYEKEKGSVHVNANARQAADSPRPTHAIILRGELRVLHALDPR
jgi:hypothetical protein